MSAPRGSAASKQLSQTDIDQMMRGGVPAEQPAERASAQRSSPDVQVYDFQRPHRVSRERLRTLEAMYGRLVKSFEGWLIGRVRGVVGSRPPGPDRGRGGQILKFANQLGEISTRGGD